MGEFALRRYLHNKLVAFSWMLRLFEEAGGGFMMIKVWWGKRGLAKEPLNPIYPFGISGNLDMWQK